MAISVNIAKMFATIVAGSLFAMVFERAARPVLDISRSLTSTQAAADGINYVSATWDVLNLLIVFFAALALVVGAVSRRNEVGR